MSAQNLIKKNEKNESKVGLLKHSINMDDLNEESQSDSEQLVNLENEYHAFGNNERVIYENNKNDNNGNGYNTMILGTGGDDSDDMLL